MYKNFAQCHVRGTKNEKITALLRLAELKSKLEMARVKHQGLDRHIPGAEIYFIVCFHMPAGKFSGSRGV